MVPASRAKYTRFKITVYCFNGSEGQWKPLALAAGGLVPHKKLGRFWT